MADVFASLLTTMIELDISQEYIKKRIDLKLSEAVEKLNNDEY